MGLLDARVDHLDQDVRVVAELDHQFLVLLHVSEAVLVNDVGVVEEQVVLRSELNLDILKSAWLALFGQLAFTYQLQDLHADGLERADLLRAAVRVLDTQFKRRLSII